MPRCRAPSLRRIGKPIVRKNRSFARETCAVSTRARDDPLAPSTRDGKFKSTHFHREFGDTWFVCSSSNIRQGMFSGIRDRPDFPVESALLPAISSAQVRASVIAKLLRNYSATRPEECFARTFPDNRARGCAGAALNTHHADGVLKRCCARTRIDPGTSLRCCPNAATRLLTTEDALLSASHPLAVIHLLLHSRGC